MGLFENQSLPPSLFCCGDILVSGATNYRLLKERSKRRDNGFFVPIIREENMAKNVDIAGVLYEILTLGIHLLDDVNFRKCPETYHGPRPAV